MFADGLGQCAFPLRELNVSGRNLGVEATAALLEPLRRVPLDSLELRRNEICGVDGIGAEPFVTYVLELVCELITRKGGGLRRLNLQENHLLGNDVYTSDAVILLSAALESPHCRLEELHLGLISQHETMRDRDASLLAAAVRKCESLRVLSIASATLPMTAILNGGIALELEGKNLGRAEIGVTAQLLRANRSLEVLKALWCCLERRGSEATIP